MGVFQVCLRLCPAPTHSKQASKEASKQGSKQGSKQARKRGSKQVLVNEPHPSKSVAIEANLVNKRCKLAWDRCGTCVCDTTLKLPSVLLSWKVGPGSCAPLSMRRTCNPCYHVATSAKLACWTMLAVEFTKSCALLWSHDAPAACSVMGFLLKLR